MAAIKVGDRVEVRGLVAGGHTGMVVKVTRPFVFAFLVPMYYVQLDGTSLGHSLFRGMKGNLRKLPSEPEGATKSCPYCAETIRAAAIKCKHCGSDLN